jgi:hypothetical protein
MACLEPDNLHMAVAFVEEIEQGSPSPFIDI